MNITIRTISEEDLPDYDYQDSFEIEIDNDRVFLVEEGEPEDNSLSRNFSDVYKLDEILKKVYEAGKSGKELILKYEDF